jgi:hypothetical protein
LANEGIKVSEGTKGNWSAPPKQQMYPDWSKIDKIAHYFNRNDFQPFPSWIYHKTEKARIVNTAEEAMEYGIIYREPTEDEQLMGHGSRYDFVRGTEWRTKPYPGTIKFDHTNPGSGKVYEPPKPDYQRSQHDMMRNLVSALQESKSSADPEAIAAIVAAVMKATAKPEPIIDDEEDRADLISIAEHRGIKVDKRWSTERLKSEVAKTP